MARLSTFSFLFHYISRPLTALECANHGWKDTQSVVDKDPKISVLSCDCCKNKMFVIDIDFKTCNQQKGLFVLIGWYIFNINTYCIAIVIKKKYDTGLYDCHKIECQWRHNKCEGMKVLPY